MSLIVLYSRAIANIYGICTIGQAIIFCQTRKSASFLTQKLIRDGHAVALLSGELSVDERIAVSGHLSLQTSDHHCQHLFQQVLDRFRDGLEKVLITTNVVARGIDVPQVTLVVNYDMPVDGRGNPDCETYIHRIGRTGRFGKNGLAINLIDGEESMNVMKTIQDHFGRPIVKLDAENVDELEKLQD